MNTNYVLISNRTIVFTLKQTLEPNEHYKKIVILGKEGLMPLFEKNLDESD